MYELWANDSFPSQLCSAITSKSHNKGRMKLIISLQRRAHNLPLETFLTNLYNLARMTV